MRAQRAPNKIWLNTVSMDSALMLKYAQFILIAEEQISAAMMYARPVLKAFAKQITAVKPPEFVLLTFVQFKTKTKEQPVVSQIWLNIAFLVNALLRKTARVALTVLVLTSVEVAKFVQLAAQESVTKILRAMTVFVLLMYVH